jgi:serine/threonine protein kinase
LAAAAAAAAAGTKPASKQPSAEGAADANIGRTLGNYRVLRRLGKGAKGVVYEAEDVRIGRRVALKVVSPELVGSADDVRRFLLEARAAARVDHPNVVTIFEADARDSTAYIAMTLMRGGSVQDRAKTGPMDPAEATRIIRAAADGLAAIHAAGMVHRDIKPANLMLDEAGAVRIGDFGTAKLLDGAANSLTGPGSLVGTPHYMSPEQCLGEPVDGRSDVYSLGATYFRLLAGRPPFQGGDLMSVVRMQATDPHPDPRSFNPAVPEMCVRIIDRAMAKDPASRYPSVRDMIASLDPVERSLRGDGADGRAGELSERALLDLLNGGESLSDDDLSVADLASSDLSVAELAVVEEPPPEVRLRRPASVMLTPPSLPEPVRPPAVRPATGRMPAVPPSGQAPAAAEKKGTGSSNRLPQIVPPVRTNPGETDSRTGSLANGPLASGPLTNGPLANGSLTARLDRPAPLPANPSAVEPPDRPLPVSMPAPASAALSGEGVETPSGMHEIVSMLGGMAAEAVIVTPAAGESITVVPVAVAAAPAPRQAEPGSRGSRKAELRAAEADYVAEPSGGPPTVVRPEALPVTRLSRPAEGQYRFRFATVEAARQALDRLPANLHGSLRGRSIAPAMIKGARIALLEFRATLAPRDLVGLAETVRSSGGELLSLTSEDAPLTAWLRHSAGLPTA